MRVITPTRPVPGIQAGVLAGRETDRALAVLLTPPMNRFPPMLADATVGHNPADVEDHRASAPR
jgi:hypothetical protein